MENRLFIIEGLDGSGKTTQVAMLAARLKKELNLPVRALKFPDYASDSSALVKMYLNGTFGKDAGAVNPYAASSFYAVDRFASYKTDWENDLKSGTVLISDRYVTSNIIYQGSKLKKEEFIPFCNWLFDFEYEKLGLPQPTAVFFLDVPPKQADMNVEKRDSVTGETKDIHEINGNYMTNCYRAAITACSEFGFTRIPCTENGILKTIEEINELLYRSVCEVLKQ